MHPSRPDPLPRRGRGSSLSPWPSPSTRRTGRGRYRPLAEINVTPLVDVMLVLLIIFMVTAPLMTSGVSVDLPKTNAQPINSDSEPLTVSINARRRHLPAGPARSTCPTWSPSCRRSRRTTRTAASSCAATRTCLRPHHGGDGHDHPGRLHQGGAAGRANRLPPPCRRWRRSRPALHAPAARLARAADASGPGSR